MILKKWSEPGYNGLTPKEEEKMARDYSDLVGQEITTVYKSNNQYRNYKRRWTIIAVYPHHVLCERTTETGAKIRESFLISELIRRGIIKRGARG